MTPTPRAPHREAPSRGVLHLPRQQVARCPAKPQERCTHGTWPHHAPRVAGAGWSHAGQPGPGPGGALDALVLPQSTALARTVTCPQRGHATRRPSGSPRLSCRRAGPGNQPPAAGGLGQCSQKWLSRSARVRPHRPLLSPWPGRSRSPAQLCTLPSEPGAATPTPRTPLQGTLTLLTARRGCFGLSLGAVGTSHPRGRLELPRRVGPVCIPSCPPQTQGLRIWLFLVLFPNSFPCCVFSSWESRWSRAGTCAPPGLRPTNSLSASLLTFGEGSLVVSSTPATSLLSRYSPRPVLGHRTQLLSF